MDVIIVDDNKEARDSLKECLLFYAEKYSYDFSIREFSDGETFLVQYEPGSDIVFLDIEMPGMNGMDAAKQIRRIDSQVVIVFVTNIIQYAINGYEVDALDYIVKPVDKYAFVMKMQRIVAHALQNRDDLIPITCSGRTMMIKTSSIMYIEASGHYTIYHTTKDDYPEYITIKGAANKLNKNQFTWISRSFYVNMKYIDAVSGDNVIIGKNKVLISRLQKKEFLEKFTDFISGGARR